MTAPTQNIDTAYQQFLKDNPVFETTRHLDDLRRTDYSRLDRTGCFRNPGQPNSPE